MFAQGMRLLLGGQADPEVVVWYLDWKWMHLEEQQRWGGLVEFPEERELVLVLWEPVGRRVLLVVQK